MRRGATGRLPDDFDGEEMGYECSKSRCVNEMRADSAVVDRSERPFTLPLGIDLVERRRSGQLCFTGTPTTMLFFAAHSTGRATNR
jgi:hypothetical protein